MDSYFTYLCIVVASFKVFFLFYVMQCNLHTMCPYNRIIEWLEIVVHRTKKEKEIIKQLLQWKQKII